MLGKSVTQGRLKGTGASRVISPSPVLARSLLLRPRVLIDSHRFRTFH